MNTPECYYVQLCVCVCVCVRSLVIIYLMVGVMNWVSVPIVAVFGAKWSMVISGALYV